MNNIQINSFKISVSTQSCSDKNMINWGRVRYLPKSISTNEFAELIKQGYCFCHCFNTKENEFGVSEKTDANFCHANMIFIDVDDSEIDMAAFIGKLSKRPTVSYTTPNNHTAKYNFKYRFRLCYLFDEAIENTQQFEALYDCIERRIIYETNTNLKDRCGRKPSQQFCGNGNGRCELHITNILYSLSDFPIQNNNASLFSSLLISNGKTVKEQPTTQDIDVVITDSGFMADINRMKPIELIEKYRGIYRYFTHTELNFQDGYAIIPTDYMEIYRSWYVGHINKANGDIYKTSVIKKLRDGDGRRKKLFIAGMIMKHILPSITFEHLLYNLVCERLYYYDNSDNVLNNNEVIRIAKEVIKKPLEAISLNSREKRKFVVDKAYCRKHGISPQSMKNMVRKKLKDEEIGNAYDCSLSLKENLIMLRELGIKVRQSRLYQWCKENGINTKGGANSDENLYEELTGKQLGYYYASTHSCKESYRVIITELSNRIQQVA